MEKKITGDEPAMPHGAWGQQTGTGLTIRQYFAGLAMQGFCANQGWATSFTKDDWDEYSDRLSEGAIQIADKLIEQLNK